MTTHIDFAEELEAFAIEVVELPGVSRTRPDAFAIEKHDLAARIRRRANELRAGMAARQAAVVIVPGVRVIDQRRVQVEVRRAEVSRVEVRRAEPRAAAGGR